MKRVVVTGAAGFIGSHVAERLRALDYEVSGVDIHATPSVAQYDLRDPVQVRQAIAGADWVVHLAADMGGVGYFHTEKNRPFVNNMRMDMNVLEACERSNVERLFFSSSACVYPVHLQQSTDFPPKLNEGMIYPANADQHYGWEKLMMLRLCEETDFARVGILHTVYGPGQEWTGKRAKFPPSIAGKVVQSAYSGLPIEIWGDGAQKRSYLYIYDAVAKILQVLTDDDYYGPVNIGAEGAVSCLEVAELCCELWSVKPEFEFNPAEPSGVLARDCDNTAFGLRYGRTPVTPLLSGFRQLMTWIDGEVRAAG